MQRPLAPVLAFVALTLGGGWLIGFTNPPGPWADALIKPPFNPPAWLFAPVWTVLFILIGVAGGALWQRSPASPAMRLWFVQLALVFAWTPTYFTLHAPGWALLIIAALLVTILSFILATWKPHRFAAYLFLPYAAWISFATMVNAAIFALN